MHFKTHGTCSTGIDLEIENGIIQSCAFQNGCQGNAIGLSAMVVGQSAKDVMHKLRGIPCQGNTSCPDQLSHAIEQYLTQNPQ